MNYNYYFLFIDYNKVLLIKLFLFNNDNLKKKLY